MLVFLKHTFYDSRRYRLRRYIVMNRFQGQPVKLKSFACNSSEVM